MHFLLFALFFLAACEDKLDKLSEVEVYSEANKHFEKRSYSSAVRFFEHYEARYPLSNNIRESMYKRAISYYKKGEYAPAIAAFEAFVQKYPTHENVPQAHRYIFFCYYNQITRFDRDYAVVQKAFESAMAYKEFYIEDPDFQKALKRLEEFVVFSKISQIQRSINQNPKLWINELWNASDIMRINGKHELSAQAYYRVIEFLTAQKSDSMKIDALGIFNEMQKYHANSIWCKKAQEKITGIEQIQEYIESMTDDLTEDEDAEVESSVDSSSIRDEVKNMPR